MKFLIDECVTPRLVDVAIARNGDLYAGSSTVVAQGWIGTPGSGLVPHIIAGSWTFVTRNSQDFRGREVNPGKEGVYATILSHCGLICLNGGDAFRRDQQIECFDMVLDELHRYPDLCNQVIEVSLGEAAARLMRYELPSTVYFQTPGRIMGW